MNSGCVILLCAYDGYNTVAGKCKYRSWQAYSPVTGIPFCDIIQVICYDKQYEPVADKHFPVQDYDKYYHDTTVIYAHRSLDDGIFTSGYCLKDASYAMKIFLDTVPYKFIAGLILDSADMNEEMVPLMHEEHDMKWSKIHPSDLFEKCFDGYSMVDITNIHTLRIKLNGGVWLNLNRQQVRWLEITGMRYFPLLIHPFRIDAIDIHVRWEQPTDYTEYHLSLWGDIKCSCSYGYSRQSTFARAIQTEYAARKELRLFYHNQTRDGKKIAYTNGGIGHFHGYLSDKFRERATKLLIKEGLHLTPEQYTMFSNIYNKKHGPKGPKGQDGQYGQYGHGDVRRIKHKNACISYTVKKLGIIS